MQIKQYIKFKINFLQDRCLSVISKLRNTVKFSQLTTFKVKQNR